MLSAIKLLKLMLQNMGCKINMQPSWRNVLNYYALSIVCWLTCFRTIYILLCVERIKGSVPRASELLINVRASNLIKLAQVDVCKGTG